MALSAALAYFDVYWLERMPANRLQAQCNYLMYIPIVSR